MTTVLIALAVGLLLSGFFSGSETGLYRATRVRLKLDALGGDSIARGLLWLTHNPAIFVATTLVGNNLANYLISASLVLGTQQVVGREHLVAEILVPIAFAPVIFVYGELLPKNLFYLAPNRLLRRAAPPFLVCCLLFAPIAAMLWALGRCLQWLVGEAPERLHLTLARQELQQVLEEGHAAGILQPAQRHLAQGMFVLANDSILPYCLPLTRVPSVRRGDDAAEVLRQARRYRSSHVLVSDDQGRRQLGYVRVIDQLLSGSRRIEEVRPLVTLTSSETVLGALIRIQTRQERIALVVDAQGRSAGILRLDSLTGRLLRQS